MNDNEDSPDNIKIVRSKLPERWGSERTIRFVVEYSQHPCLWDFDHPEYKDAECRERALRKLVEAVDMESFDVQQARKKIRSIRNTYSLERLRIEQKNNSGIPYESKLSWYSLADQFLGKVTSQLRWKSRFKNAKDNLKNHSSPETAPPPEKQLKMSIVEEDDFTEKPEENFSIFGKHVATQLRKLPMEDALEVEIEVNNAIAQRRLSLLRKQSDVS